VNAQVDFWRGSFGSEYTQRNRVNWEARRSFWELILENTAARSVLEVGCNAGWNLRALRAVDPTLKLRGVDVNADALAEAKREVLDARELPAAQVGHCWPRHFDLVFTAGVLIHVAPEHIVDTMRSIARASSRYVLAVEYESVNEDWVEYRGHRDRLWRRPFGEMYEAMGLDIVLTGTVGPGDGFDDCAYWLLRKEGNW
jgi:pseudaminic acid biosynthesis-associated methylase